jgi:hypothetical protein
MKLANFPIEPPRGDRDLNDFVRDALLEAIKESARPLVRLCVKHGISFQDLASALRYVFVDSADEDYLEIAESSPARIAVLTGIPRPEVESLLGAEPESKGVAARMNASIDTLSAWHSDPDFTGPYGIPMELPLDGPNGFNALARRHARALPPDEVLAELIRSGCVAKTKKGAVKVLRRSYISGRIDPVGLAYVGKSLKALAETLEYNLEKTEPSQKRFQRQFLSTSGIRPADLNSFIEIVKEAGQKFLEDLDSWTSEREKALAKLEKIPDEIPRIYPGVGMYMFFDQGPTSSKSERE